ncbi:MAG TPA: hypothetical protein VLE97_06285 [Gaiellaceae bacterium]|nr:hypothetical protein [Gaiellaceae bacterium]
MFKALYRTATEICDSKKAAYSFLNMIGACVLHLCFAVSVKDALVLVSPLTFLTFAQAFVDACAARQHKRGNAPGNALPFPTSLPPPAPVELPPPVGG